MLQSQTDQNTPNVNRIRLLKYRTKQTNKRVWHTNQTPIRIFTLVLNTIILRNTEGKFDEQTENTWETG